MIGLLKARTLSIDIDGTVLCTGHKVGGACRGYNPHHRKVPSYYPITAYLADSGHFLRLHNRPGNVNDGASSIPFLFELFNRAGHLMHPEGRATLRLQRNKKAEKQFRKISAALRKVA